MTFWPIQQRPNTRGYCGITVRFVERLERCFKLQTNKQSSPNHIIFYMLTIDNTSSDG